MINSRITYASLGALFSPFYSVLQLSPGPFCRFQNHKDLSVVILGRVSSRARPFFPPAQPRYSNISILQLWDSFKFDLRPRKRHQQTTYCAIIAVCFPRPRGPASVNHSPGCCQWQRPPHPNRAWRLLPRTRMHPVIAVANG